MPLFSVEVVDGFSDQSRQFLFGVRLQRLVQIVDGRENLVRSCDVFVCDKRAQDGQTKFRPLALLFLG